MAFAGRVRASLRIIATTTFCAQDESLVTAPQCCVTLSVDPTWEEFSGILAQLPQEALYQPYSRNAYFH